MYIKEVGLKNYQIHSNTIVKFNEKDNAIIGASDSGKTALKRAIECVLYNDYSGVDYIKEGEDKYSVYVLFSDGTKITRESGLKKINRYIVEKNGEKIVLENFGKSVPEEVTNAHKMYKVQIGKNKDSLFCARQLDGPFFLQNTPEEKASIISSIAKTEIIDEAVSITLGKLRDNKKEQKILEKAIKQDEESLKEFNYINRCEEILKQAQSDLDALKSIYAKLQRDESNWNKVMSLKINKARQNAILETYEEIEDRLLEFEVLSNNSKEVEKLKKDFLSLINSKIKKKDLENILSVYSDVDTALDILSSINSDIVEFNNKKDIFDKVQMLNKKSEEVKKQIEVLDDIEDIEDITEDTKIRVQKFNYLSNLNNDLNKLKQRSQAGIEYIKDKETQINKTIKEYEDRLASMGTCPICFSKLNIETIREELLGGNV